MDDGLAITFADIGEKKGSRGKIAQSLRRCKQAK
jgi:hypothetical protein